jgi:hypothetical protein
MKRKKVWRFYCEHCGKSGCSGGHIASHERHCTMNPDRRCGMCRFVENYDGPEHISILMAALRRDQLEAKEDDNGVPIVIPNHLSEVAEGCPACMLAAIRQYSDRLSRLKHVLPYIDWDFTQAKQLVWADYDKREDEFCHHG